MPTEQRVTFCRICEALCGLTATVEGGRVVALRPDREHPVSRGYACPKGMAMTEVQNDPDRVLHPLRRRADGGFERVSWPAALEDIGRRLRAVRDQHGPPAIAWYMGQPGRLRLCPCRVVTRFHGRPRLAQLLHGGQPGRQQPLRRSIANGVSYVTAAASWRGPVLVEP